MRYKACIFDFDLTLADSSKGILICFKHTLKSFGYNIPDDDTIYGTIGKTLVDSFDVLTGIPNNPLREQMRVEYVKKADDEMVRNTFFYDGAAKGLAGLQIKGIKVGICSTKYRYRIEQSFAQQLGCLPIDLIVGGEDVTDAKPDPQGLLKCISGLGVSLSDALYIGDNIIDAQTAQNANVDFAAVLTGSTTKSEFLEYPNVNVSRNLGELFDFINKE